MLLRTYGNQAALTALVSAEMEEPQTTKVNVPSDTGGAPEIAANVLERTRIENVFERTDRGFLKTAKG